MPLFVQIETCFFGIIHCTMCASKRIFLIVTLYSQSSSVHNQLVGTQHFRYTLSEKWGIISLFFLFSWTITNLFFVSFQARADLKVIHIQYQYNLILSLKKILILFILRNKSPSIFLMAKLKL